jgi:DNA repair protein RecO
LAVRTQALVLRRIPFGDTSWILHAFTREEGKVSLLARGARRNGSPFAGAVEPLCLLEAVYAAKPGREIHPLTQASLLHAWPSVRSDLPSMACALAGMEALEALLPDPLPHEALFERAVAFLASLESGHPAALCLARLLSVLCQELGISPRLDSCARCGSRELAPSPLHVASLGGVVCEACAPRLGGERLTADLLDALIRRAQAPPPRDGAAALQVRTEAFLYGHLLRHTPRAPKLEARALWNEVRP